LVPVEIRVCRLAPGESHGRKSDRPQELPHRSRVCVLTPHAKPRNWRLFASPLSQIPGAERFARQAFINTAQNGDFHAVRSERWPGRAFLHRAMEPHFVERYPPVMKVASSPVRPSVRLFAAATLE